MDFLKGRMTTVGVVAAILALVAVQAVAFSQSGQKPDAFKPNAAADDNAQRATTQTSDAPAATDDTPVQSDPASEQSPTTPAADSSSAAKPAITGASLDDEDGEDGEDEGEEDDD